MRARDPRRLAESPYDLLVIGGGIHGLTCAYEGASRGLRVALVEAGDFGGGTSFNHQKTAHGGLRALQSLSLGRAREGVRERRALARIAPWLLRPLPFLLGTYRTPRRSRLALRAAFRLDRWIGRDRNEGLEPELHLPAPRLLSRTAASKLFPGIEPRGLTGGAQWYDYQMVENDRLTFAFAAAADRAGADLVNHASARAARRQGTTIVVSVRDELTGDTLDIQTRTVVNTAGAHAGEVMRLFGVTRDVPLLKAMNLVTSKPAADIALAAPDASGRMLTLVPWRGVAIVGTWQSAERAAAGDAITAAEVEQFVGAANSAFPALKLQRGDVRLVHRGVVPAVARGAGFDLLPTSSVLDHRGEGAPGVITVLGAKYTTARATADRVIGIVGRTLGRQLSASRSATQPLPGAGMADHEALAIETAKRLNVEMEPAVLRHLVARYAEDAAAIVRLIAADPESAAPIAPNTRTIVAEVLHVIRHESACRLSDIVLRRTTIGAAGPPPPEAVDACAAIAARELGWSESRRLDERAELMRVYE